MRRLPKTGNAKSESRFAMKPTTLRRRLRAGVF
jgi:hypothetical protein